ncbi:4-hydroxythreonine-4-phosphate dehydrogenase PdxA [Chondromyces apiculatus]|uniref:4-hydroxythreonine-4-phosphate dehydrogenase n=1 Tax=Chondromyces apiculatus DSM 436 TaxID=1192034 RepID=A0A017TJ33_9BACT|nr:4-hydroxythreonine-4-phosphate dehydrogenase PdxA [Chondromyces apiculatus]EYF08855.1 4-hydroxythreonine-4-phosphate dehydrogenase [Chondromyces apiculatus DSM 436]
MKAPLLAISLGCPSGVGPEVAVVAAARSTGARCLLVGDEAVIRRAAALRRVAQKRIERVDRAGLSRLAPGTVGILAESAALPRPSAYGEPGKADGAAQLAWIDQATDLVRQGYAQALVTGPVSKLAIATSGAPGSEAFLGHTEHLARRLGAREVTMAFASDDLVTALVTTHLPLSAVPEAVTPKEVARATFWLGRLLHDLGRASPKIAVAALNPHAGEGGLLGDEEQHKLTPGIRRARRRLTTAGVPAEILGPVGAETAFRLAAKGVYDGVVAMYHDQATIPSKLLGFGEAVNVTLGLPIVRTSVDHGTAHDVAGTGRADARGMREAIALAVRLAR